MNSDNSHAVSSDELAIRNFVRNQRDVIERLIEQAIRKRGRNTKQITIRCYTISSNIADAPNREVLVASAVQIIAHEYLAKYHSSLRMRRVRVLRFFPYDSRTGIDVVIFVRKKLFGLL